MLEKNQRFTIDIRALPDLLAPDDRGDAADPDGDGPLGVPPGRARRRRRTRVEGARVKASLDYNGDSYNSYNGDI